MSNTKKIKIAMVDDHQIVIDGIKALLQQDAGLDIVATSVSAENMLQILAEIDVDILLTDVVMDGMSGQQLAKQIRKLHPAIKIMALSMSSVGEIVEEMINDADISGYLLKQTGQKELIEAIKIVHDGGIYFQPKILDELEKQAHKKSEIDTAHLTLREIEIIKLIEKNLSNKEIATELNISVRTVETHRKNILRKTDTNNSLGLIKWAKDHNIIAN